MSKTGTEQTQLRIDARLDDFAYRCFRDTADQDYIAARLALRYQLIPQFHWGALQAIEKYIKCILLLNRIPARNLGHDLAKALRQTAQLPFDVDLSESSREFVEHIDRFGKWRYLEGSYVLFGPKLVEMDRTVWEVRRYCQRMNYDYELRDGTKKNLLQANLNTIALHEKQDPRRLKLFRGLLEKIVEKQDHPARSALVWNNLYFGKSRRRSVKIHLPWHATNAPLSLEPRMLDEVLKYVYLPQEVIRAYRNKMEPEGEWRRSECTKA